MSEESERPAELAAISDAVESALASILREARAIPLVRRLEAGAAAAERTLRRELSRGLDAVRGPGDPPAVTGGASAKGPSDRAAAVPAKAGNARPPSAGARAKHAPAWASLGDIMGGLLEKSILDTPHDSRRALHWALIRELVPDEARILAALADGSVYPLIHVAEPGRGGDDQRVLENASSVGRAAGVVLVDRTHLYVGRLRRIGLVETAPQDPGLREEYEILLTDVVVRAAMAKAGRGPRSARVIRRTLRISQLGRELWDATQGHEGR